MANTPAATSSKVIPHPFGNFSNDLTKKGFTAESIRYQLLAGHYRTKISFSLNKKQNEELNEWFEDAKSEVFIKIDPEYNSCGIVN